MLRPALALAAALCFGGCATTISPEALAQIGRADVAIGLLPIAGTDWAPRVAARMEALGVFSSVETVDSRRAPGTDIVLDIEPATRKTMAPTVTVYSTRSGRRLRAFQPRVPFNEPGMISPENISAVLLELYATGAPDARALAAERESAARERPARAAPAEPAVSREELAGLVKAAVASAEKPAAKPAAVRSDVDEPRRRFPERPDDFALVVGIEKYSDLPDASFAERDARAVKEHLLALGVPERNVIHLAGDKAGRSALAKYLELWLPRNVTAKGRLFFYFSGHGAPDVKTGQAYLVPWDGDANFLEATGYPVSRLYEKLHALKAREVVVALDACFSGAGGRSVLAKGARPLVTKVDAGTVPADLTVLAAASEDEITSALDEQGHGIFTYYLLKGLGGAAADGSGVVTAKGLFDYLRPKVQDAARRQNREQTPVLRGARTGEPLVRFH